MSFATAYVDCVEISSGLNFELLCDDKKYLK